MPQPLNSATLPLKGRHLIEASAGTGKTFTVANLYVRLLIDARDNTPPTVDSILVVTFTRAATEELRRRLLERIRVALEVIAGINPLGADETLHAVLEPHIKQPETRSRLELAYRSMDQAAIFTIDSFCDRVLCSQAFESGELFHSELLPDTKTLNLRATEAWWRQNVTPMSRESVANFRREWATPSEFLEYLSPVIEDPDGCIIPSAEPQEVEIAAAVYQTAFIAFVENWRQGGDAWVERLKEGIKSKLINKGKVGYTCEMVDECSAFATELSDKTEAPSFGLDDLWVLGNKLVGSCARAGKEPYESEIGECIDELGALHSHAVGLVRAGMLASAKSWIHDDLTARKYAARQRTFKDSLLKVHTALYGEHGERLIPLLQDQYKVGIIDEFQDTDRLQFGIFDRLFPAGSKATSALYLIGDPKQSIYRFRGADIDVYLHARETADGKYPLDRNWRSSSCLIGAVNALYATSEFPFGSTGIQYHEVSAGGAAENSALEVDGCALPPLQFDFIPLAEAEISLPEIDVSKKNLAAACAYRVAWLLGNPSTKMGQHPIKSSDIAILVWTHNEAEMVRQALSKLGLASAVQSRENVFKSTEVLDLTAFLRTLLQHGDSASLSRVLVSPLGGFGAAELLARREDAAQWQKIEDCVQRCREQYVRAGPLAALLSFMKFANTRVQALATPIAQARRVDRVLSNYLHLADALQKAWQRQPDLRALIQTARRWREEGEEELVQLRLESDSALVQIVTVHKSKGMEYPIVMLPFACMGRAQALKPGMPVPFIEDGVSCLDVGSEDEEERKKAYITSLEDETLRTLYVALTRAEQSIWIGVTPNKNAKNAALWNMLKNVAGEAPLQGLKELEENNPKNIQVTEVLLSDESTNNLNADTNSPCSTGQARTSERNIELSWRVGSYTAITRGATIGAENPDHDAVDRQVIVRPDIVDYNDPFHFPRGAAAGTLIHDVFEHLDFKQVEGELLEQLVLKKLQAHSIGVEWASALCQLVKNTLYTPLSGAAGKFSLSTLENADRIDELRFDFPVSGLDTEGLEGLLKKADVMKPNDTLQFNTLNGFMTGFIDLIFRHEGKWYIADYKSNHLGYHVDNYQREALSDAMRHHRYDLQYLIYAVALRRYLALRVPGFNWAEDFGGVYYLFVRGMAGALSRGTDDTSNATGVFTECPPESLLQELDDLLHGVHYDA